MALRHRKEDGRPYEGEADEEDTPPSKDSNRLYFIFACLFVGTVCVGIFFL